MTPRSRALAALVGLLVAGVAACTTGPSPIPTPWPTSPPPVVPSQASSQASSLAPVEGPPPPDGFPLPSGAVAVEPGPDRSAVAAWSVPGVPSAAYQFFVEALPGAGFALEGLYPGGGGAVLMVRDAEGGGWEVRIGGELPTRVELVLRP